MTQPVIEPFVPSSDSLFDPIYLKSTPGKNRGPTGFPVHKKAELFQYYEDRGLVPVDKHFISWVGKFYPLTSTCESTTDASLQSARSRTTLSSSSGFTMPRSPSPLTRASSPSSAPASA